MNFQKDITGVVVAQRDVEDATMVLEDASYDIADIVDISSELALLEVYVEGFDDMDNLQWVLVDGGINFDWE
tara:strand:- start:49 stop:264 length:216 start_codon:yes stop_codon:yes gene_type:complete